MIFCLRENCVYLVNHHLGDRLLVSATDSAVSQIEDDKRAADHSPEGNADEEEDDTVKDPIEQKSVTWKLCAGEEYQQGFRFCVKHCKVNVNQYFALMSIYVFMYFCIECKPSELALQGRLFCNCCYWR